MTGHRPPRAHTARMGGVMAAKVRRRELHESMLEQFAAGIRDGVPARVLDGYSAMRNMNELVVVNRRDNEIERIKQQILDADRSAKRARRLATEESDTGEDDAARGYRDDARRYARDARRLRQRLTDLQQPQRSRDLGDGFEAEVTFLLEGLRVLTADQSQMTVERWSALQSVLHGLRLDIEHDRVRWTAQLRVLADGDVIALGPFTGTVANVADPRAPAETAGYASGSRLVPDRQRLRVALERTGLPSSLASAAVLAPGLYLPRALAGERVIWPECPASFDHDRFNRHLLDQWHRPFVWSAHRYAYPNQKRQTLTDLVAALGGRARLDQIKAVCAELGLKVTDIHPMSLPRPQLPNRLTYLPSVRRAGTWQATTPLSDSILESIPCPNCYTPATAVVRVPEVPGNLLCRSCLTPPADPTLTFPPMYVNLALPPVVIRPDLLRRTLAM